MDDTRRPISWIHVAPIIVLGIAALMVVCMMAPLPQDTGYHDFADQRTMLGIPHFWNVVSNAPFAVVGIWGIMFLCKKKVPASEGPFLESRERLPYLLIFLGVALTSLGSAYYHWHPSNQTLFWDRLPMTFIFLAFFAVTIAERINVTAGLVLLGPLLIVGVASVSYWQMTELQGRGDLRWYVLVQFYPLAAIPLMLWLLPARYTGTRDLFIVLGWYVAAKVFEELDAPIYHLGTWISGHTLKHLAAAMGCYWLLRTVRARVPLPFRG